MEEWQGNNDQLLRDRATVGTCDFGWLSKL